MSIQHLSNLSTLKVSSRIQNRDNKSDAIRSSGYYNTVKIIEENAKEEKIQI